MSKNVVGKSVDNEIILLSSPQQAIAMQEPNIFGVSLKKNAENSARPSFDIGTNPAKRKQKKNTHEKRGRERGISSLGEHQKQFLFFFFSRRPKGIFNDAAYYSPPRVSTCSRVGVAGDSSERAIHPAQMRSAR